MVAGTCSGRMSMAQQRSQAARESRGLARQVASYVRQFHQSTYVRVIGRSYILGAIFWFIRNRLVGSYFVLSATRR